jgi:hypothetical protein
MKHPYFKFSLSNIWKDEYNLGNLIGEVLVSDITV